MSNWRSLTTSLIKFYKSPVLLSFSTQMICAGRLTVYPPSQVNFIKFDFACRINRIWNSLPQHCIKAKHCRISKDYIVIKGARLVFYLHPALPCLVSAHKSGLHRIWHPYCDHTRAGINFMCLFLFYPLFYRRKLNYFGYTS